MCTCNWGISNLTINLSMKCNMHCKYCYVYSQEISQQEKSETLTVADVERVLYQYADMTDDEPGIKILDVSWHGGEPLLLGLDFFRGVIEVQRKLYESKRVFVRNRLQTNATLINDDWAAFFAQYKFAIGISLDGNKEIHDTNRYYCDKRSAFNETIRGINLLKKYDVPFGILSVVTNASVDRAEELYNFFKDLDVDFVDFIPSFLPEGGEDVNVDPVRWGKFLIDIYDLWIHNRDFEIGYLENLIDKMKYVYSGESLEGKEWMLCEFSGECGHNLSLTPDGSLYLCECLIGLKEYELGNVFNSTMREMFSSKEAMEGIQQLNKKDEKCKGCNIYAICEGGCIKHKTVYGDSFQIGDDVFCVSKKMIVDHIRKSLQYVQACM